MKLIFNLEVFENDVPEKSLEKLSSSPEWNRFILIIPFINNIRSINFFYSDSEYNFYESKSFSVELVIYTFSIRFN